MENMIERADDLFKKTFGVSSELGMILIVLAILAWVVVFWNPPKWLKRRRSKDNQGALHDDDQLANS